MPRLPRPTGKELIAALAKVGFDVIRVRGSHHFVKHPDGLGLPWFPFIAVKRSDLVC